MVLDKRGVHFIGLILIVLGCFTVLDIGFASSISNSTRMTVFITNTAPVIVWANVTPNPVLPGNTIIVRANASDVNGDQLYFNVSFYNTTHKLQGRKTMNWSATQKLWINSSFAIPVTADAGQWDANFTFYDGFVVVVNRTAFTVSSQTGTKLQNSPVDFGNQTVGQVAQRAENGTAVAGKYSTAIRGWPLIINNTGNTKNNYTINGSDLKGPTKTIGVGNVTWQISRVGEGAITGKYKLAATHANITTGKTAGTFQKVYFWISTPNGITQQRLNGTIVIRTNTEN